MTKINDSGKAPQDEVWFMSDPHLGHKNIIKYCDRPFRDTDHMDETIINNINAVVPTTGTLVLLGDLALGDLSKSLPKFDRINAHTIAIMGNHDRPFMKMDKASEADEWIRYAQYFDELVSWTGDLREFGGREFMLSHFPYTGDHTPTDRHVAHRPVDNGIPLIHGHTHEKDRLTFSSKGTVQVHVGVDAWDFKPVSLSQVLDLVDNANAG